MPIDFFEKELMKVWKRFNDVYGGRDVKGLDHMYSVILAITGLGVLKNRIKALNRQEDRKDFMQKKTIILNTLDTVQSTFRTQTGKRKEQTAADAIAK